MSDSTANTKKAWIIPTMEVVANVSDIATGGLDIDEDFTGSPLNS